VLRRLATILLPLACTAALVSAATATAKTQLPGIVSPSGNIKCLYVPGHPSNLLCSIAKADYAQKLQANCMAGPSLDWHGFGLTATGKGARLCSGGILYNPDKQVPHYATLAYGKTWQQGGFTCTSRVAGITCHNRLGHGLFISRQTWRAW
jgi:hypothetical protein